MCSSSTSLESSVDALAARVVGELSVAGLQALVAAVVPQVDRLLGVVWRAVGELQVRTGGQVPDGPAAAVRPVSGWLREVAGSSGPAAGAVVRTAVLLRELPQIAAAVVDGAIGPEQARVLTRLVGRIPAQDLLQAQPALLAVASDRDPISLAMFVNHLIATYCEPALEADERNARSKRFLQCNALTDGLVRGSFALPAEDAESLLTVLEPLARRAGDTDDRSAGQRRADALIEICELTLRLADLPDAGGRRPQLSYVVPANWATGATPPPLADVLAGELGHHAASGLCATAAWTGPQTRTRIEALLCDARITRVLLSQTGQVQRLESLTDTITPAQRRAVAARDQGCATRGCTRPPAACDAHHLTARQHGGQHHLDNVVLMCRRHHVQWHRGHLHHHHLHLPWLQPTTTSPPRE